MDVCNWGNWDSFAHCTQPTLRHFRGYYADFLEYELRDGAHVAALP